jgi:CBS domain-containing protein
VKGQAMKGAKEINEHTRVSELLPFLKERKLPLINEKATIEKVIKAMVHCKQNRLLYVVDDKGKLTGAISLGVLVKHAFSQSHEPQIHARFFTSMITTETAEDIMQKNPVATTEEEEVGIVFSRMIKTNVKEIPVLDTEKRVIADLTMVDLLEFLIDTGETEPLSRQF